MNKIALIITFIIYSVIAFGQKEADYFDLDKAVNYALSNSPEYKQAVLDVEDARLQKIETRAIGLPKLSVSGDYKYFFEVPTQVMPDFISPAVYGILFSERLIPQFPEGVGKRTFDAKFGRKHNLTFGASLNSIIFSGEYIVALKTSRVFEQFANQQMASTLKKIKDKTIEAYLPALIMKENLDILNKNIANVRKLKKEMEESYKEGFVEQLDVDRLRLSLENLAVEKENILRQTELLENVLKLTIGYPLDKDIQITDKIDNLLLKLDDAALMDNLNMELRPDYLTLKKSLELQNLNVMRYKTQYLPTLSGFATYNYQMLANDRDDLRWIPNSLAGIKISMTLFDGFDRRAKIQRAKVAKEKSLESLKSLENAINLQVQNGRLAVQNAEKTLNARKENLKLAEKIYSTTKTKYKEGVGSSVELTQAEQSLYQAQANVIRAKYDLLTAKFNLKNALGK